jgi:hypothetical protein
METGDLSSGKKNISLLIYHRRSASQRSLLKWKKNCFDSCGTLLKTARTPRQLIFFDPVGDAQKSCTNCFFSYNTVSAVEKAPQLGNLFQLDEI